MKTITRKSMLYKTGVEYGDYTMNHVLGCFHGCKYPCYAYLMAKRFGNIKSYGEWCKPKLVSNTLELLDKEIPKLKNKIKSVQLCFTTDPFMEGYPEVCEISLKAIKKLNDADIQCNILTKGKLPLELKKYSKKNEYGITLVSLDEKYRNEYEPNTVSYIKRISALKKLHDAGCKTWVSIEPYPTPNIINQDLMVLLEKIKFVDKIIFGRTHYNKIISEFKDHKDFYNKEAEKVIKFCKKNDIIYYIKKGTLTK
ncbi:MAG: radical SAM protein [Treponema sp.]|nr:radical SAM protein [Treponema sp.]